MIFRGRTCTTSYTTYKIYDYEIFDSELQSTKIKVGNIQCVKCFDIYYTIPNGAYTKFIISDGIVSDYEVGFSAGRNCDGSYNFIKLIHLLEEIDKYKSISAYQVFLDNEKLRKENERLNKEIEALKEELKTDKT